MVAGGYNPVGWGYPMDTVETLGSSGWILSEAKLPWPRQELRAANINGRVLIFGTGLLDSDIHILRVCLLVP